MGGGAKALRPFAASPTGLAKATLLLACQFKSQVEERGMKSQIIGLQMASAVFALMALAQLGRLIARPEILVAGYRMPLWPSALASVFLVVLSVWMWSLSHSRTK